MTPRNEDFLFAQEAQRRGYVSEDQVDEAFRLQSRMLDDLQIDERIGVILVKRGWLGEEQARRVQARLEPDTDQDEIEGYRFVEKIGRGAMGTVYKAVHLGLQRPVAVKILRRDLARDQIQVERLKEEAKLLASLDHPNIVRALDAGESRGFPFVVMEYVEGETLKDRLARDGPMHEIDALRIARGIADALERARRMGVVHRDVKPGNIICSVKDDEPKLMDLGLAKGPVDLGLTQHGATVGTPQYISPEQAQDPRKADIRSDIYSLGATLYALVTGRPPFSGATLAEILTKVLYEAPVPPRVLNKKVSPEVGYLIERMMLKDPALRYRTPADVVHDIDEILAGRSIIPEGFTGNWEAYLLRQKIRKWIRITATAAVIVLLLTAATVSTLKYHERKAKLREGREKIAAVLDDLQPYASDTRAEVRQKHMQATALRDDWEDYEPEGYDRLRTIATRLTMEMQWFEDLDDAEDRLTMECRQGNYAKAYELLAKRKGRIPQSADSPAAAAIQSRMRDVIVDSDLAMQEVQNTLFAKPAQSVEELIERHEQYELALGAGLYESQAVRDARRTVGQATAALISIKNDIDRIDADFSASRQAARLRALDFETIKQDYDIRRSDVEDRARRAWDPLDQEAWLSLTWRGRVGPLVELRLRALDRRLADAYEQRADQQIDGALAAFEAGRSRDALKMLSDLEDAARRAGLMSIWYGANHRRTDLQRQFSDMEVRAAERLREFEDDLLERIKAGDPDGVAALRNNTLADVKQRWPFRDRVEATKQLEQALRDLYDAAYDGLFERMDQGEEIRNVQLRNGDADRRWWLKLGSERATWTVVVARMRSDSGVERHLSEVAPGQLAEWAKRGTLPLPPLVRAVVALGQLPDLKGDLRPVLTKMRIATEAFDEAQYEGALAARFLERYASLAVEQQVRERNARGAFAQAQDAVNVEKNYGRAHFHLWQLLDKTSLLRFTDFFESQEERIRALYAYVEKQVANAMLAKRFPGTRLTLEGEVTRMVFDFDDAIQLETFRLGWGRATGVREPYTPQNKVVTPTPRKQNHRFHLLRGMEGLVRNHPLVLPCIFDPAAPIRVQFDLHTLDSPFFLVVDIDGLQVGVLSADPGGYTYRGRWQLPEDVPAIKSDEKPPTVSFYGRGRGVAFHAGRGFGDPRDPRQWTWPVEGVGRNYEAWAPERRSREMEKLKNTKLFCFEQSKVYRVEVLRERGRLTLSVDGHVVLSRAEGDWARVGGKSDRDRGVRGGTGLLQILTWTPQAIDDLVLEGVVLDHYQPKAVNPPK